MEADLKRGDVRVDIMRYHKYNYGVCSLSMFLTANFELQHFRFRIYSKTFKIFEVISVRKLITGYSRGIGRNQIRESHLFPDYFLVGFARAFETLFSVFGFCQLKSSI